MDGIWDVFFEDKPVGTCRVWREGLYFHFSCRCDRVTDAICRLQLECGGIAQDIGVLVPIEGGFGLERKIPVKNIPTGALRFWVTIPDREQKGRFVPVLEGEEFAFLSGLSDARFGKQNGEVGVFLG